MHWRTSTTAALVVAVAMVGSSGAQASSHREAPFITKMPKVDGTDLYMFRSYEPGREGFVTLIANYVPLQDPFGGPNYFFLDPDAVYEIHVDNNGDAIEDLTFQFRPEVIIRNVELEIGAPGATVLNSVPVYNVGQVDTPDDANLVIEENYTLTVVRGPRRTGTPSAVLSPEGDASFDKPADFVGTKSFPDYATYADAHMFDIDVPGCDTAGGRVFVGQRNDPFVVSLGDIFDLINIDPADVTGQDATCQDPAEDDIEDKNVTTFALEIPIACLTAGTDPVIGAWTTASVPQARVINPSPTSFDDTAIYGGPLAQVSRLGLPLVNELIIGLNDKDRWNTSEPTRDASFLSYVTHPVLPEFIEIVFADAAPLAPNVFPRQDLVDVFLLGIAGVNRPALDPPVPSEQLRLNTTTPPTAAAAQNPLGVVGGDNAGFPNGRRPVDDVVDIELRVAMGALLPAGPDNPAGALAFTDCAPTTIADYPAEFPYVATPIAGNVAD